MSDQTIDSLRETLEHLRVEEKRLVKLMARGPAAGDLFDRIQANLQLMRQVAERLAELERVST
jgi:hypothetical protein